jgi:replicative DNA helicase
MNVEPSQLPADLDGEACMLCSYALGDEVVRSEIAQACSPWMVLYPAHQTIYAAMLEMQRVGKPIDPYLLFAHLKDAGHDKEAGGAEYIARIFNAHYTPAHGKHYAGKVADLARRRRVMEMCEGLYRRAVDRSEDIAAMVGEAIQSYGKLLEQSSGIQIHSAADLMAMVQADMERQDEAHFIRTGLGPLDKAIIGLEAGTNTIIAARPSVGKSTLARQLLSQIALSGTPIGVLSLEEQALKVGRNLVSKWGTVANQQLRNPKRLDAGEMQRAQAAMERLKPAPIYLVDNVRAWGDVEAAARLMHARHKVQVIALDHLHLLDDIPGKDVFEKTTEASHRIKWLWKSLGVAGVTVTQLNRGNEAAGGREPTMSDLRESGHLEQDADMILLLHRQSYYSSDSGKDDGDTDVIIAKNRDGVRGVSVPLRTELKYCRFVEKEEEVPDFDGGAQ